MNSYKRLIISGGGIKGIMALGVVDYLSENLYMDNISTFIGVSIGSVIATGLVLGYTSKELYDIFENINLSENNFSFLNFLKNFGFHDCNDIVKLIIQAVISKGFKKNITFGELYTLTSKNLVIVSTNINRYRTEYFSHLTTPDMQVLSAIRLSINIPFYFNAVSYKDDFYIDGAMTDNFPVDPHYPDNTPFPDNQEKSIIIKIISKEILNYNNEKRHSITNFVSYAASIFQLVISLNDILRMKNVSNPNYHIICIDPRKVNIVDLDLGSDERKKIFLDGFNVAKESFKDLDSLRD